MTIWTPIVNGNGAVETSDGLEGHVFISYGISPVGQPPGNRSRRAIDALHLGTRVRDPRPGDLAVMRHHVTIVAGFKAGQVIGLGGNQGRRVKISHYDARRVVGYVRVL